MNSDSDDLRTWWNEVDPVESIDVPDAVWNAALDTAFDESYVPAVDYSDEDAGRADGDDDTVDVEEWAEHHDGDQHTVDTDTHAFDDAHHTGHDEHDADDSFDD